MKRVVVLLTILILQSPNFSQDNGTASNQLLLGVATFPGSGSEIEVELEQNELGYAFQFDHFFTRTFTVGLEANYVSFATDDEESQAELTGLPAMLALKRYLWNSKISTLSKGRRWPPAGLV